MQKTDPMRERAQAEAAERAAAGKGVVRPTVVAGKARARTPAHLIPRAHLPRQKPIVR